MFKAPFSFKGRIRRTEYVLSYIIYVVFASFISILMEVGEYFGLLGLFILPMLWFLIAQATKRCHDRGNSGWYQIIPFYFFWMVFAESEYGENEYGKNPKGNGNKNEIDEIGIEGV
jgi:uncharacterized membrane protein YhaH (DUF805 family)